ncbi:hypothetical protein pb186bvf_000646 [Paramecium bursaria]
MNQSPFDINKYLERIGLGESILNNFQPNWQNLYLITYHQSQTYVYENLTLQLDITNYKLDIDNVFDKLVINKKGGICYELQELIFASLQHLGYKAQRILSEVCSSKNPNYQLFTHEVILVTIDDQFYIVDVGFGANCPRYPLKFRFDKTNDVTLLYGESFQLEVLEDFFRINLKSSKGWVGMMEFEKDKQTGLPLFVNYQQLFENFQEFLFSKKSVRIRDYLIQVGKSTLHGHIEYTCNRKLKTLDRVEFKLGKKVSIKQYNNPDEFIQEAQKEFQVPLEIEQLQKLYNQPPYLGEI